jgi:nicotinamidase-related amidase
MPQPTVSQFIRHIVGNNDRHYRKVEMSQLAIPSFFDVSKAGEIWRVPYAERADQAIAWGKQHGLKAAASDKTKIALLGIDIQPTFCFKDFELYVIGAEQDCVRTAEFIYRNLGIISSIHLTMDMHRLMQIFHPFYWVDEQGNHPAPATMISVDDVKSGKWKVNIGVSGIADGNYTGLQAQALHYVEKLANRYPLIIWPYHAMLGGIGQTIVPLVEEAAFFYSVARSSQINFEPKGGNPLTENYSVLRPEVLEGPAGPIATKNARFFQALVSNDYVVIGGQAKSHCVAWTIQDMLDEIMAQDPNLVKKVYLLEDCTSPVVIPGVIDFTQQGNDAFAKFQAAGMHIVKSTTPIDQWPGVTL